MRGYALYRVCVLRCWFAFVLAGCEHVIAPPEAPAAVWPHDIEMRITPPDRGKRRIAFDANGEHASVVEVTQRKDATAWSGNATAHATEETTQPVCLTPCVVDLPPGMHVLRAQVIGDKTRQDDFLLQIGDQSKVVRHAIGRRDSHALVFVTGMTLSILGSSVGGAGAAFWAGIPDSASTTRPLAIGGAAAVLVGIPLMIFGRTDTQEGSTTQFAWR